MQGFSTQSGRGSTTLLILFSLRSHPRGVGSRPGRHTVMEDLTRFALFLLSAPVVIVTGGVVIGLIGRYVTGRR